VHHEVAIVLTPRKCTGEYLVPCCVGPMYQGTWRASYAHPIFMARHNWPGTWYWYLVRVQQRLRLFKHTRYTYANAGTHELHLPGGKISSLLLFLLSFLWAFL